MRLSVIHETVYDYAPPVDVAQHIACLEPQQSAAQRLLSHSLVITPTPVQSECVPDVFGNRRSFFSLQVQHTQLRVVATSTVQTLPLDMTAVELPWEQAQALFRYRTEAPYDSDVEFVFNSPYVPRHAEFAAYAQSSFGPGVDLHCATLQLMQRIHHDCAYDSESTEIHTPALEALRQRRGVCQDFAHIMIACLRSLGLAARYVSGYLLTKPPPGKPRLVGADASHAWVSLLLPTQTGRTRWCDFDPTNNRWGWGAPGEDYVVLAIGRDFADVSPIRGVIHGGASHELTVAVTVTPLDESGATLSDSNPANISSPASAPTP